MERRITKREKKRRGKGREEQAHALSKAVNGNFF